MKQLFFSTLILFSSMAPLSVSAMTPVDDSNRSSSSTSDERSLRGELKARYPDGKIETSIGSFSTSGAEVIDRRPIDNWYKEPSNAQVSLYFKNNRLFRVVIY